MAVIGMPLRKENVVSTPVIDRELLLTALEGRVLPQFKDVVYSGWKDNMGSFFDMYMDKTYVQSQDIRHIEQHPLCYMVTVGTNASATTAGGRVWVPISASDMQWGGRYSLPQIGFTGFLPPLGHEFKVVDVDRTVGAHRMQIAPMDRSVTITLSAGDVLPIAPANVASSGDCADYDSTFSEPGLVYKSKLRIARRTLKIKGSELAEFTNNLQLYALPNEDGTMTDVYWHALIQRTWEEFLLAKYRTFMVGQDVTNPDASFNGQFGSAGLLWALRARGDYYGYTDTFDKTDWQAITAAAIAQKNPARSFAFWQGFGLRQSTDRVLADESYGKLSWGAFGGDQEKWINYGFSGFRIDDFEFYNKAERMFSDPCFLGATGFTYNTSGIMVPLDMIQTKYYGGQPHTHVVQQYLNGNGFNREMIAWDYGLLKPGSYSGNCDNHTWQFLSEFGLDVYFPNHFILVDKL